MWAKKLFERFFEWLEKKGIPWYKLPKWVSILSLAILRNRMRRENLKPPPGYGTKLKAPASQEKNIRPIEGDYTNLEKPMMGKAGTCFGRNLKAYPLAEDDPKLLIPNPREVSVKLLARKEFIPATSLNLLAAAWIQFQTHGWFRHVFDTTQSLSIPISDEDDWPHERPIKVHKSKRANPSGKPPAFINELSHWWDGAQIYGCNAEIVKQLRSFTNGKLHITKEGLLMLDPRDGIEITGMRDNWWVGLSLIHTLFTLEHNAICDQLKSEYPQLSDESLFQTARLINAALMAKVQTVEWTLAILNHPVLELAMNINWKGLREQGYTFLSKIIRDKELVDGILGSPAQLSGVDYHLTEEFASVYRMHPLIPDEMAFHSVKDHKLLGNFSMENLIASHARDIQNQIPMTDLMYSFGISHPGAIALHNYPNFLRNLKPQPMHPEDPQLDPIDLAAVELMRDRERGLPRYQDFRKGLHMPPIKSFEELTGDKILAEEIESVYKNLDEVDLMVGLFAEQKPKGFGFSDTAFRIFVLMASRRLECDRFFTTDYNETVYTKAGLEWVENNSMVTILLRHYPGLELSLAGVQNAFVPWEKSANN